MKKTLEQKQNEDVRTDLLMPSPKWITDNLEGNIYWDWRDFFIKFGNWCYNSDFTGLDEITDDPKKLLAMFIDETIGGEK